MEREVFDWGIVDGAIWYCRSENNRGDGRERANPTAKKEGKLRAKVSFGNFL
jgi:hypothetical protein